MHQDPIDCNALLAFIRESATEPARPLPSHLAAHVQGCAACRARLYTLFYVLGVKDLPSPACGPATDLAAFVEEERLDPEQARIAYPGVWSHLWICPSCLRTYDLLIEIGAWDPAAQRQLLPAPQVLPPAGARRDQRPTAPLIHVVRQSLNGALPRHSRPLRSGAGNLIRSYQVLELPPLAAGLAPCKLLAHQQPDGDWLLEVAPLPAGGSLVLTLGAYSVRGAIDRAGHAFLPIPDSLLTDRAGPGLDLALEEAGPTGADEPAA